MHFKQLMQAKDLNLHRSCSEESQPRLGSLGAQTTLQAKRSA